MSFTFRGLEMHGRRLWERSRIQQALAAIRTHDMTALVLHEPDIMHQLVFPRAFFDPYAEWKSAPTRRGENAIQNNRVYFEHVLNLAHNQGTEVWLEVKELTFPDEVLEARPDLIKDGVVCPSEPFWREFITAKTEELLADFPLLAGIILSPGSPEGRAARSQNKCRCEVCAATLLVDWYDGIIRAMHGPLAARGKRLAVRDFAYDPKDHEPLIEAVARQPADVVFCIKTTPHDFYPTFPDNPAFGRLADRPQWVEYDVQGQFYGWGVFPCLMFADIRRRLAHAEAKGASGGLFRTEWERINDLAVLDGPNAPNLVAAAMLSIGPATDAAIAGAWLRSRGWPESAAPWLAEAGARTWPIMRDALYIDDFLFSDCSMFPRSIGRAWWTMELKHALVPWSPAHAGRLDLDAARIAELLAQKQSAVAGAHELVELLEQSRPDLPVELLTLWRQSTVLLPLYIEGMQLCAEACLRARWQERDPAHADRTAFVAAVDRLDRFADRLRPLAREALQPHQVVMLLDAHRVDDIVDGARRVLATPGSMKVRHVLLALLVAALWGFNFVVIRAGLDGFPPLLLAVLRFVVAALPAAFLPRPAVPWPRLLAIAATLFIGQFALLFTGMAVGMPPGLASVTTQSQAFFTVLIAAVVLRERPTARQGVGILVAFAGLAVIAFTVGSNGVTAAGLLLTLGGALSWGAGNVLLRGVGKGDMLAMVVWLSVIPILPMLALAWAVDGQAALVHALATAGWLGYGAVLYLGVMATLVGYGIWGFLLRQYTAATVVPFALLAPIFGAASAALVYGETFGPWRLAGMVLILLGLAVVALPMPRALRQFRAGR